jgi:peptidoglycan/LPS O-acetylase OafA/YrhL
MPPSVDSRTIATPRALVFVKGRDVRGIAYDRGQGSDSRQEAHAVNRRSTERLGSFLKSETAKLAASPAKIETLTSLRFFAAFAIVLYHLPALLPSLYAGAAFSRLSAGVDFFFVLSGYVLGVTYGSRSNFSAGDYFRRRFARIYPVYLLTILWFALFFLNSWPIAAMDKFNSGIAHLLLVHAFLAGPFFTLGFNAPGWTISCEAFFYAVFPLIRRRGALVTALVALALFVLLYRTFKPALEAVYPSFFTYFPLMEAWKFAAGLALAQLWTPRRLEFGHATALEVGAVTLLAIAVLHDHPLSGDIYSITLVAAVLAVIAVFACQSGALSRILLLPALVLLGEASYSLYLWHYMLMLMTRDLLPTDPGGPLARLTLLGTVVVPIVLVSVATYRWFELPLRNWIAGLETKKTPAACIHSAGDGRLQSQNFMR